jgi:4'-phosphopantetheinyl transferase
MIINEVLPSAGCAQTLISSHEVAELQGVHEDLRTQAFFNCWTRKEAYIKARGGGLSMPLNEFDVSLAPGEAAALIRNHKDEGEVSRWSMKSIDVADGYVAALVAEGHDWALKVFDFK